MLQLKNVTKSFVEPDGTVLKILDIPQFQLAAGEQVVLMGQSGSGKTTLLHVISGISRPDGGQIIIDGTTSPNCPSSSGIAFGPRRSATSFRRSICWPGFSALENVMLGMSFARGAATPAGPEAAGADGAGPPADA